MIDSALKKGPKFPKFIHPYPAFVEKIEYPKCFKISDFSLFDGESSLSSLEHVARFTTQCGDVNSDSHKLRLFNFPLTGSAFAWYINLQYICKALAHANPKDSKTRSAPEESTIKTSKVYTFDITKADAIFDQLLLAKIIKLRPGHNIPKVEELKGKTYCKYHDSNKHMTNNCVVFRDAIQSWINNGKLKFPEKKIGVDIDPFPTATLSMIDAHLPGVKGKRKVEFFPIWSVTKQNSRPRLKIDLFSNEPPQDLIGPAFIESMSSSSAEETNKSTILCSRYKADIVLAEPKEKPR